MTSYKVQTNKLRKLFRQAEQSYRASITAADNGDYKNAVAMQLSAVESMQAFEDQLLKELDRMRTGKPGAKVWAP